MGLRRLLCRVFGHRFTPWVYPKTDARINTCAKLVRERHCPRCDAYERQSRALIMKHVGHWTNFRNKKRHCGGSWIPE